MLWVHASKLQLNFFVEILTEMIIEVGEFLEKKSLLIYSTLQRDDVFQPSSMFASLQQRLPEQPKGRQLVTTLDGGAHH